MATKKFYRITYKQKSMEVEEFPIEWPDVAGRINKRAISRLPDKPVITLVTETSKIIEIVFPVVEKWVNPEN